MNKFLDIRGYEGFYQVNKLGEIKSVRGNKILKFGKDGKGYCYVNLCINNQHHNYKIHRLVAETFILNPENKPQVNHKNGIKSDNRVENLEWCTASENHLHAYIIGIHKAANRKLTESKVIKIKNKYNKGISMRTLSKIYKVHEKTIYEIVNNIIWKNI